ncbi:hypothetical protein [Roseomonas marmotae]|uniref:Uncharacterized protein n=1 Tax=Roseomonas marmotae TaxID=2768161 RepID=A0ABS3K829_9PROT|nr:hypothetical protein [Roseomonas marmotae]MBO1073590.1 hypothetical protein [Roseomonas marmotae]QTI80229.1 hypothetical protein IAI58_05590 [Roseomonas marmotae]
MIRLLFVTLAVAAPLALAAMPASAQTGDPAAQGGPSVTAPGPSHPSAHKRAHRTQTRHHATARPAQRAAKRHG